MTALVCTAARSLARLLYRDIGADHIAGDPAGTPIIAMQPAAQRSNFREFTFYPGASPKRLLSLRDIFQITKPAVTVRTPTYEVWEWTLVDDGRTDKQSLATQVAEALRASKTRRPTYQQTLLQYHAPRNESTVPEFNAIYEEAQANVQAYQAARGYVQVPRTKDQRSAAFKQKLSPPRKPALSPKPVSKPPAPVAKPVVPPVSKPPVQVKPQAPPVSKPPTPPVAKPPALPVVKPSSPPTPPPAKPVDSLDAISILYAAEAEKSRPPVIDVDAPPPQRNGDQNNHSPPEPSQVRAQGPAVGFACPVPGCTKVYRRRCRVIEHMRMRHNPEGVPRFQCNESTCLKSYARLDALKLHDRAEGHRGYTILFAPHNGSEALMEDPPEPIKIRKVGDEEVMRFKCKFAECEKSYSTRYRLNMHETACHGSCLERPFACNFPGCPKAYATKDSLTRHRRGYGHGTEADKEEKELKVVEVEKPKPKEPESPAEFQDRVQELVELFERSVVRGSCCG